MLDARVRRQNHSCEQCRKSKKACDGYLLNSQQHGNSASLSMSDSQVCPSVKILPCSYCTKTQKQCSLNPHWGQPQPQAGKGTSLSTSSARGESASRTKRQRMAHHDASDLALATSTFPSSNILHLLQTSSPSQQPFCWSHPIPTSEVPPDNMPMNNASLDSLYLDIGLPSNMDHRHPSHPESLDRTFEMPAEAHQPSARHASFSNSTAYSGSQVSEFDLQSAILDFPPTCLTSLSHGSSEAHSAYPKRKVNSEARQSRHRARPRHQYDRSSPSPFGIDHFMMTGLNNHLITESLLRIYHDVLENNLACWLSEDTCPYKMQTHGLGAQRFLSPFDARHGDANVRSEWGVAWSNRMYRRVVQLDRVAKATGMTRLTQAESKAASKALSLAIMAFATQWSQGKQRRKRYRSPSPGSLDADQLERDLAGEITEEFEQNVQQSVWEQAKRALQDVADLESYRVVYAELIFGLIQKPWSANETPLEGHQPAPKSSREGCQSGNTSVWSQVLDIIAQQGPPTYMERATQRMHALKFRFDANESGFLEISKANRTLHADSTGQRFTTEDRGTIGLLYWLAVMFDTVSSSMNERPVSLADEDCQHDAACKGPDDAAPATEAQITRGRWEVNLFVQDNLEKPTSLVRWPCSYEVATKAVARSAPVKILIFRYVSYLQNSLRKRDYGRPIEDIIRGATLLYRYWNKTYGTFFRDLIRDYDSIPARLKSWFVCIAIPWHLGSLLLADLIDFIDENGLGLNKDSLARVNAKTTTTIRKASASELADLARVTTPLEFEAHINEPAQLPDLHFAVNEGSLLTEPWTMLLIRAFTKASLFYLDVADDLQQQELDILGYQSDEFQDSLRRTECCVKGLWFLGRKSEMARSIAEVLSQALYQHQA